MPKVYRNGDEKIVASIGEPFVLALAGNPTTGYDWQLDLDDSKLSLISEEYQPLSGNRVGGGSEHRFTLQPIAPGQTSIRAKYKQAWEAEHLEQQEISVHIKT